MLLSFNKHIDTLIERTKTTPQETLEYKMNKQLETFSVSTPRSISDEGKWLLAVISFVRKTLFLLYI